MLNNFQIITVTHRNLDIADIGKFTLSSEEAVLLPKLKELKKKFQISELSYLSTCNRVSYIMFRDEAFDKSNLRSFFAEVNPELKIEDFSQFINLYSGNSAIRHYFEVASSIDSLVVGEREIFRQIRTAYNFCWEKGLTGDNFRLLDKNLVVTAKEVYAKTRIGEKPLSIVSLAMQKLKEASLHQDARILLIGAGETNRLVGKFLKKASYSNVVIFNRSLDNAVELSEFLNAKAFHLNALKDYTEGFDAIVICTSSIDNIIKSELYENLLQGDQKRKLVVDLAVPRNVDSDVVDAFDIKYVDIEQLRSLAETNLQFRKSEVIKAKAIVKERLEVFKQQFLQRQIELALQNVPGEIKSVKEKAISSVFKSQLDVLDKDSKLLLFEMMDYMEKKCISIPMKAAKTIAE